MEQLFESTAYQNPENALEFIAGDLWPRKMYSIASHGTIFGADDIWVAKPETENPMGCGWKTIISSFGLDFQAGDLGPKWESMP